jgi:hypothetical protein
VPRTITSEVRKRVGIPRVDATPYRWSFAGLVVLFAAAPLLFAKMVRPSIFIAAFGLLVVPAVRWYERREARRREILYETGLEAVARVSAIEPGTARRADHIVRVDFWAGETHIQTIVMGSPLARRGLEPGEDVIVYYDEAEPHRCLVIDRVRRKLVVVDAI